MSWDEYGTGDGQVHPGMPDHQDDPPTSTDEAVRYGDTPRESDLFNLPDAECAKELLRRWQVQDTVWQRNITEYKVNARRMNGDTNVWMVKDADANSYRVYTPPGASSVPVAVFNKQYRLCDRLGSVVFSDDPKLEAEVPPNDPKGATRARLATNILKDLDSEGRLNDLAAARHAFGHWGAITGTGYVHYFTDPHAGGRQPITVKAAPQAQTVDDATRDPMTGMPWADVTGAPIEPVERFVREDGTLADDPQGAASRWMPGLTRDVLGAHHVRFEPHNAADVWDADGVHIAGYYTWEQVLRWQPKLAELPPEEITRLTTLRPEKTKDLLPWVDGRPKDSPGNAKTRERLVFVMWTYFLECPAYADGFHAVVVGDHLAHRQTWVSENGAREPLDLPITPYKQFDAPDENAHGWGVMHLLGPAGEWRAELVGAIEDVLDRIRNRKTFVPTNSILQTKQHLLQGMSVVPINEGGQPFYEDVPTDALKPATQLFEIATREMDDASTMQEAGQGLQVASVTSGKQAQTIQSQVAAGQSFLRQNCANALTRAGRIKLQLLRSIATTPQLVKYAGGDEDAVEEWVGSDLKGITNVKLVPGSFSGLTPMQKAERAMMFGQAGMMPPDELAEAVQGAIGSTFGWQENPHATRCRRQVARWERAVRELPPDAKMLPPQMSPPIPPQADPTGMQIIPGQPPMPIADPQAAAMFEPRPVDAEPRVAIMRARILGNAMAGDAYDQAPVAWRVALDQAYQQAAMAAAPPMPMAPPGQDGAPSGEPSAAAQAA